MIATVGGLGGPNHIQMAPYNWIRILRLSPQGVVPMMLQWMLMTSLCLGRPIRQQSSSLRDVQLCKTRHQDIQGQC